MISKLARSGCYLNSGREQMHQYTYDRVFDENSTQRELYEGTTKPLITSLMEGVNCTVFAYGATGAGKVYILTYIHALVHIAGM